MTLEPESQTSAYLYYVTMFVKQDDRRRKVIPVIEKSPSPLQPKKQPHEELAVEGSDIEDVTDDILFKKARADHIGFAKGESDQMTQRSLDHYRWQKLDEREKLEQSHKDITKIRDDMETFCNKEEEKRVIKKQHVRDMAHEWRQRHRDRVKARKAEHPGKPVCNTLRSSPTDTESNTFQLESRQDSPEVLSNIAALSRPESVKWKKSRCGKKGGTVQQQHRRTN